MQHIVWVQSTSGDMSSRQDEGMHLCWMQLWVLQPFFIKGKFLLSVLRIRIHKDLYYKRSPDTYGGMRIRNQKIKLTEIQEVL